ncbi:MAG TPA: glycosyltransferase, partial [Cyclobacteriaceae bacterium]|nr:glycosyltransferase [Cyclobacteriaceae bacterium]
HMTTQGFISLEALAKLAGTKPIVWTLHDMWPFTGGCVYSFDCDHFKSACGNCPFLKPNGPEDLSNRLWEEKKSIFEKVGVTFVAPSQWMADKAAGSSIGKFTEILKIHNTIDTDCFCPSDTSASRELLGLKTGDIPLLFGAQNIDDERKGFHFLKGALESVKQRDQEYSKRILLLVFGATKTKKNFDRLPVRVRYFGSPANTREIIHLYRAALYYIHCATADNLPNTVVESLSCGTPVIAFNSGGVNELVQAGFNGYLADPGNEISLADTILKAIKTDQAYKLMAENARNAAVHRYSMKEIAGSYNSLYEKILNNRN